MTIQHVVPTAHYIEYAKARGFIKEPAQDAKSNVKPLFTAPLFEKRDRQSSYIDRNFALPPNCLGTIAELLKQKELESFFSVVSPDSRKKLLHEDTELQSRVYRQMALPKLFSSPHLKNAVTEINFSQKAFPLKHLEGMQALKSLCLRGRTDLKDEDFAPVAKMALLELIDVSSTHIDGSCFQYFAGLPIKKVVVDYCDQLTDLVFVFLGCFQLEHLSLAGLKIQDETVEFIVAHCPHLRELNLDGCSRITDRSLKAIATLQKLERLNLRYCKVSDEGMKALRNHPTLRFLDVEKVSGEDEGGLTDDAFESIGTIANLEELCVMSQDKFTDKGLEKLKGSTKLQKLDVSFTKVTGSFLASLYRLTALCYLRMSNCPNLKGSAIIHIQAFRQMKELSFNDSPIGNDAVGYLVDLPELAELDICYTQVTNAVVSHIDKMRALQELYIVVDGVTRAATNHLKARLKKLSRC